MSNNNFEEVVNALYDDENNDVIIVEGDSGQLSLEQIAVVPREDGVYAILKPISQIEGLEEDEALVFFVDEDKEALTLVTDERIIDEVFDVYFELIEEESENGDTEDDE